MADPNLSVCVHGCDHLNREFASGTTPELVSLSVLAMERMQRHEYRTGVPFDPVMVFPQGKFSKGALSGLRQAGFLAAVNTNLAPADTVDGDLTLADLLQPAVTKFFGFPVFARRYPRNLMALAFDLFLGRPALIVEHHEYFRAGCGALQELVESLSQLDSKLSWPPLGELVARSCLTKVDSNDRAEVLFFTNTFQFSNQSEVPRRFLLSKQDPDPSRIRAVLCDAIPLSHKVENGHIRIEIDAAPGQTCKIKIVDEQKETNLRKNPAVATKNARVILRRGLSEFRDNVLANHAGPLGMAQRCVRALKLTGDSAIRGAD